MALSRFLRANPCRLLTHVFLSQHLSQGSRHCRLILSHGAGQHLGGAAGRCLSTSPSPTSLLPVRLPGTGSKCC